jgi:DNA-binding response OmpR family regulator
MSDQGDLTYRILLLETDQDVVEPLSLYFRGRGAEVQSAPDQRSGLPLAARTRPDVILLASRLADDDGLEVYRRLRSAPLTAHVPILFIVSHQDAARQNQLLAAGADDVILRPFDVEILALRVRNAVQRTRREGLTDTRTGLPTGPMIVEKIAELNRSGNYTRLELSIAHFDAFRTRYNFISGNDVLRFAANTICEVVDELSDDDFVGQREDALFVVLTAPERSETVKQQLTARLNEGLLNFYTFMERDQGFIQIEDGQGGLVDRPLMHLEIEEAVARR